VTSEVAARIGEGLNSPSLSLATVLGRCPALRAAARSMKAVPVDTVRRGIGAVWSNEFGDTLAGLLLKMWFPDRKIFPPTALRELGFDSGVLARVSATSPLLGSFATDIEQDRVPETDNDGDADFVEVNAGISSYLKYGHQPNRSASQSPVTWISVLVLSSIRSVVRSRLSSSSGTGCQPATEPRIGDVGGYRPADDDTVV
jgi:hypothetical protein